MLIAKQDRVLIEEVLRRGADLGARATGAFFKPKRIPPSFSDDGIPIRTSSHRKSALQRVIEWLQGSAGFAWNLRPMVNDNSGCEFGEFPLQVSPPETRVSHAAVFLLRSSMWLVFVRAVRPRILRGGDQPTQLQF